ncbi:MAG: polysaccharide lyase family protein, partial [Verrucomicrobia bacterium]|nr:polysaccharide lyase family protein [Verrucomicrobiota bacterium]
MSDKSMSITNLYRAGLVLLVTGFNLVAADSKLLWQIGNADHSNAEFALAPGNYAQYRDDALFVVGRSTPANAWPYVHPGPSDNWAGSREHVFTVLFGVKQPLAAGSCKLVFDLLDTQSQSPPKLRLDVNGHPFERQMPAGGGDASVHGEPAKGKPYHFTVEFPSSMLQAGNNQIDIANIAGSWLLYDSVALETPAGIESAPVENAAALRSV